MVDAEEESGSLLDGPELARRIREAMDKHQPKIKSSRIAELCKVTPQAVNGWRKTGRVAKRHLAVISRETEKPLEHFLGIGSGASEFKAELIERQIIKNLRRALPEWRNYVISLAMMEPNEQEVMLKAFRKAYPEEKMDPKVWTRPDAQQQKK